MKFILITGLLLAPLVTLHTAETANQVKPNILWLVCEDAIRMNYAKYYDAVENMDAEIGKALATLDKAGLTDDTIIIFNSDHGGVLPRSKRFLYDSGTHVPLIIRIPEKWKHLWPAEKPGDTVDRLVSFLDLIKRHRCRSRRQKKVSAFELRMIGFLRKSHGVNTPSEAERKKKHRRKTQK